MEQKYEPIYDKIIVQEVKSKGEEKIGKEGILFKPNSVSNDIVEGVVFAAGDGRFASETGVFMPTRLRKGDKVLYPKGAGIEIPLTNDEGEKEDMRLMTEADVLVLLKNQ